MYFSIVLRKACWASLVSLSTSVNSTTEKAKRSILNSLIEGVLLCQSDNAKMNHTSSKEVAQFHTHETKAIVRKSVCFFDCVICFSLIFYAHVIEFSSEQGCNTSVPRSNSGRRRSFHPDNKYSNFLEEFYVRNTKSIYGIRSQQKCTRFLKTPPSIFYI